MSSPNERLRQVIDAADIEALKSGGLGVPTLFEGHDGSYWVLVEQWEAWRGRS